MTDFIVALGLAAVLEGVLYALAPGAMKRFLTRVAAEPEATLRWSGLALAVVGVLIVWAGRG